MDAGIILSQLPFYVIVEQLKRVILEAWQARVPHVVITGSTAMRLQMAGELRTALTTGMVDLDLLVHADLASFNMMAAESASQAYMFLTSQHLDLGAFDYKIQAINKVIVVKYFWHTFRFLDAQWLPEPLAPRFLVQLDNGFGGSSLVTNLDCLRMQSERVLADDHLGRPGDNSYRKEKDKSRIACLREPSLWYGRLTAPNAVSALVAKQVAVRAIQLLEAHSIRVQQKLAAQHERIERVQTTLKTLGPIVKSHAAIRAELERRYVDARDQLKRVETRVDNQRSQVGALNRQVQALQEDKVALGRQVQAYAEQILSCEARCAQQTQLAAAAYIRLDKSLYKYRQLQEVEAALKQAYKRLESAALDRVKERLVSLYAIMSVLVQSVSFYYSMERATEYARAQVRSSSLLYNLRKSLSNMFSSDDFEGTCHPTSFERQETGESIFQGSHEGPKDFSEFGREEIATAVRVFVESFGPFASRQECDAMCAWRDHETVLDYLSRINSYVMLRMAPSREPDSSAPEAPAEKKWFEDVYLTSRTKCIQRTAECKIEGGLSVRIPNEPFSLNESLDPEDLDNQAQLRISKERDAYTEAGFPSESTWMFDPIPSFLVEVKQDKLGVADVDDVSDDSAEGRKCSRPFLRDDWQRDPCSQFTSVRHFARIRSCANIMTTISYAMWNRMSVSVISKLHKHARIASEILFRLRENEETAHSFTLLFASAAERAVLMISDMSSALDEAFIVYNPCVYALVEDLLRPYALLKRNHSALAKTAKELVRKIVPLSMITKHETIMTIDHAVSQLSGPEALRYDLSEQPASELGKREKLKAAIAQKRRNRAKK